MKSLHILQEKTGGLNEVGCKQVTPYVQVERTETG